MDVHPLQNGAIGYDPWPHGQVVFAFLGAGGIEAKEPGGLARSTRTGYAPSRCERRGGEKSHSREEKESNLRRGLTPEIPSVFNVPLHIGKT